MKLSGPQQKFCDGIVSGLNGAEAYRAAYPKCKNAGAARTNASRLLTKDNIIAEIARQRAEAEKIAGSSVLTLAEKRTKLARIVRAKPSDAGHDNPDCNIAVTKMGPLPVFPDKLAAIKLDNDLSGQGSEAEANDALTALLGRVMK